jgi:3-hydroxyacyl-[acyl-carrier-protein] dehydratase
MSESVFDIEEIKKVIPHRYPFLLIDRVTEINGIESIKGFKNVTNNESFLQGHFPANPVFPGVLILEAMAQLGAVLVLKRYPADQRMAYFASIDKAKFKKVVVPGDRLDLEVQVTRDRGSFVMMEGKALVEGQIAARADLACSIAK